MKKGFWTMSILSLWCGSASAVDLPCGRLVGGGLLLTALSGKLGHYRMLLDSAFLTQ